VIGDRPRPDRSAEEREAARLERERARREREKPAAGGSEPAPPPAPREPAPPPAPREPTPPPRLAAAPDDGPPQVPFRERVAATIPPRLRRPPGGGDAQPPPRRRRLGALLVLAVAAVVVVWFLAALLQPFKGDGHGAVAITIPRGSGVGDIGDLLASKDVVSSGTLFELRTTLGGHRGDLKPGVYTLRHDMSYGAAIDALVAGPPSPKLFALTLPEGLSRAEVARKVEPLGLDGGYQDATKRSRLQNPRRYGAKGATDLEGFLFPATYQLRRGSPMRTLVDKQLTAFKREFAQVDLRAARKVNLTAYDVLTIASLVEREAQLDRERKVIASVIYNRLHQGIPLGIDATVRFATGNWASPLKQSELDSPSPYNTRKRAGLPPGPIGSPGLASIEAAAHPAHTSYLFYVVKPGRCGEHAFSSTDAQFQRDVARYNRARSARGGKSPTTC
jgi:UPF0755 protein